MVHTKELRQHSYEETTLSFGADINHCQVNHGNLYCIYIYIVQFCTGLQKPTFQFHPFKITYSLDQWFSNGILQGFQYKNDYLQLST